MTSYFEELYNQDKKYSYKECLELSYKALDLIPNLKEIFYQSASLDNIMLDIYDAVYYHAAGQAVEDFLNEHFDFFKGSIFNWMTDDEFIQYCNSRFPEISWGHRVKEEYWVSNIGGDEECS